MINRTFPRVFAADKKGQLPQIGQARTRSCRGVQNYAASALGTTVGAGLGQGRGGNVLTGLSSWLLR